jgi:hypothetical protein
MKENLRHLLIFHKTALRINSSSKQYWGIDVYDGRETCISLLKNGNIISAWKTPSVYGNG